nr:hypothetical protein [Bacteroidota bacterium]
MRKFLNICILLVFYSSFFFWIPIHEVNASGACNITPDTLYIKKGTQISIDGQLYIYKNDTTLILPDSIIERNPELKSRLFYSDLKNKADKYKVTKKLYNLAFSAPKGMVINDSVQVKRSEKRFDPYDGKIIRNIRYKVLNVIGPTVYDTTREANAYAHNFINNLSPTTRKFVLRDNLLFKEGQPLDPLQISNSGRIIREMPSIKDARIEVVEPSPGSDSVDVIVIVKDIFPYGVGLKVPKIDQYDLRFWTVNFMGLGHRFDNTLSVLPNEKPFLKYSSAQYRIENIAGTFIEGELRLENNDENTIRRVALNRRYMPLSESWGGELKVEEYRYNEHVGKKSDYFPEHDTVIDVPVKFFEKEFVLGRSFIYKKYKTHSPDFLALASSFTCQTFSERPDTNIQFQNRSDLLASLTFVRNNYYQSRYVNNFGITEDIPYGLNVALTGGYEYGGFFDRTYLGLSTSTGNYLKNFGYIYAQFEIGSFIRNKQFEQGLITAGVSYYSKLVQNKTKYKSRLIVLALYTAGINRYENEELHILNDYSFKGLSRDSITGNKRLSFSAEIITYTPWYFYGFQFAFNGFVDIGIVGSSNSSLLENKFYSGIGAGLKVRNESLVFETIQFTFTFYPIVPEGSKHIHFELVTKPKVYFPNFEATKPLILPYKYYYQDTYYY